METLFLAPNRARYAVVGEGAKKLKRMGLPTEFEALSIGSATRQVAIIPLDEAGREDAEVLTKAANLHEELLLALGRAADRLAQCSNDILNPCWDDRADDVPGKHWGGGQACAFCTAAASLAKAKRT